MFHHISTIPSSIPRLQYLCTFLKNKHLITDLIIGYPWWFLLFVIFTGLIVAGLLYYKNKSNKLGTLLTVLLFIFRFTTVFLLAFLLLSPFLKTRKKNLEKPIILIGIDNSRSLALSKDSAYYKSGFISQIKNLEDKLSGKYNVDTYLFGDKTRLAWPPDFEDGTSNYANLFKTLKENYAGMNVGALIVAGDGINNRGIDPVFAASALNYPVYTIAMGDTTTNKDLKINDVRYNSIVYRNEDFPVEVNLVAEKMKGNQATVSIYAFGKLQAKKQFFIGTGHFNRSISFILPAKKPGMQRIRIKTQTLGKEANTQNNVRDIFVNILENRRKILIMANAPHPDIAAIRESLQINGNFKTDVYYPGTFKGKTEDYDLVIFHNLPSVKQPYSRFFKDFEQKKIPALFITGKQTAFARLKNLFTGVVIRPAGYHFDDAQAEYNPAFSLFNLNEETVKKMEKFPPLVVPLGNYQLSSGASVLAWQRISKLTTNFPLIVFDEKEGIRRGMITGEGLWMWRMYDYLQNDNTGTFDELLNKTVQLLLARKDKRFFRITTKHEYTSGKDVTVKAELYNQSWEPVNDVDVNFILTNEDGEQYNYVFSPFKKGYVLNLKKLPVGVYNYSATAKPGNEKYKSGGEFIVAGRSLESRNLNADYALLYRLAQQHDGRMIFPGEIKDIPKLLSARDDLKTKVYYEEKYTGLNAWPYLAGLIMLLLAVEWFLRKYFGSY